jgi:hypothetical protein
VGWRENSTTRVPAKYMCTVCLRVRDLKIDVHAKETSHHTNRQAGTGVDRMRVPYSHSRTGRPRRPYPYPSEPSGLLGPAVLTSSESATWRSARSHVSSLNRWCNRVTVPLDRLLRNTCGLQLATAWTRPPVVVSTTAIVRCKPSAVQSVGSAVCLGETTSV